MKNFFKKLSFVLAIAMVLTSIAPATASAAEVVPAKKVNLKVNSEKVEAIDLEVGEETTVKVGLPVKKAAKEAGLKSTFKTWYVVDGDAVEVVRVGNRTYELTGVEAGEATVTIGAAKTKKLAKAGEFKVSKELKVVVEAAAELAVEATGANELTVTLPAGLEVAAADVVVKRGTTTVNATAVINGTTAVVTTDAKMIAGTYTVTIGELAASCDVEAQIVDEIVILNDGDYAATNVSGTSIYVYYDVLDQYGDSLRASSTIQWTHSLKAEVDNRNTGCLELKSDETLNYNSSVYLTAVYSKGTNVRTKSAEVKVGLARKADSVEVGGIVKEGVNEFTTLTASTFKADTYLLAFTVKDQYGNPMDMNNFSLANLSFNSLSPLLLTISKTKTDNVTPAQPITIGDVTYATVYVQPEDYANKGGTANVSIVSTSTGTVTNYEITCGEDQILTTFTMDAPSDIVAEGETAVVPFTALDQNGEAITSFRILNGNVTLTASSGDLVLYENNDGTATLKYEAETNVATKDVDHYVTLTSVVTTGSLDTENLYVKDAAYPAAIKTVEGDTTILEGDGVMITPYYVSPYIAYFTYVDQYGRDMKKDGANVIGWFQNANNGIIIKSTTTTVNPFLMPTEVTADLVSGAAVMVSVPARDNNKETVVETVDFALKNVEGEVPGSNKKVTYKAIDISKLVSFVVNGIDYTYVTSNADYATEIYVGGLTADGTYVNVPLEYKENVPYFTVTASAIWGNVATVSDVAIDGNVVTVANIAGANAFKDMSLYSNPYRDEKINIGVIINDVNNAGTQKDRVDTTMVLSNKAPYTTSVNAGWGVVDGKAVVNATNGTLTLTDDYYYNALVNKYSVTDQYNFSKTTALKVIVSKYVENEAGQDVDDVAISNNNSTTVTIANAEIGDTFTVTFTDGVASLTIDVTVGADNRANFGDGAGRTESAWY